MAVDAVNPADPLRLPSSATAADPAPTALPAVAADPPSPTGPGWRRPLLVVGTGLLLSEGLSHLLPIDAGAVIGLGALAGGWWWLRRRRRPLPALPRTSSAWLEKCEQVLAVFARLEGEEGTTAALTRRRELALLAEDRDRPELTLALSGCRPPAAGLRPAFALALRCPSGLRLQWGHPLPAVSEAWCWPEGFAACDVLLHHIDLPLRASDLRWLEALPAGQPVWLLVESPDGGADRDRVAAELAGLWPAAKAGRLLLWDGGGASLATALQPLALWLAREGADLRRATNLRRLEALHGRWQAELEQLRRGELQRLLQRTQWLVAGGVILTPLPSLDLLVLAAANGLMLQEMARLWDCAWSLEQLRAAALELGRACLALGVVEWTSQALAAAVRLDGATWLVGSALQALSAAYLTRVVGHAMADVLALSAGVSAPDLEAIKRQAPVLVAQAAEAERLDWGSFLQQGVSWLRQQAERRPPGTALQGSS